MYVYPFNVLGLNICSDWIIKPPSPHALFSLKKDLYKEGRWILNVMDENIFKKLINLHLYFEMQ